MVSAELLVHIRRHLQDAFVLFVGDPAQLPPVGEVSSQTFGTKGHSHLDTIVRQGAGNPVLDAAHVIRGSQGGPMDWTWVRSVKAPPCGVFLPANAEAWMQKAFTSPEFDVDPDRYRYLCWTNARVAEVNQRVRQWRYGDNIATPFMPDEQAMFRAPLMRDGSALFNTNEEARVVAIGASEYVHAFDGCPNLDDWSAVIPTWRLILRKQGGSEEMVHMPREGAGTRAMEDAENRLKDEARECRGRWRELHVFQSSVAKLQSIYAMTVHTSQGSTFTNAFVDVPDIRQRADDNVLEAQQLFYVAATRPTDALILVGAAA